MGPIWGRQDRGTPHVGPMNIRDNNYAARFLAHSNNNKMAYFIIVQVNNTHAFTLRRKGGSKFFIMEETDPFYTSWLMSWLLMCWGFSNHGTGLVVWRIMHELPWITTLVTSEVICQWFSRLTKSRVKIIGKSPHKWPKSLFTVTNVSF